MSERTVEAPARDLKELRLGLVCYGGVSLAIYMHGVTKEIHRAVRASVLAWKYDRTRGRSDFALPT